MLNATSTKYGVAVLTTPSNMAAERRVILGVFLDGTNFLKTLLTCFYAAFKSTIFIPTRISPVGFPILPDKLPFNTFCLLASRYIEQENSGKEAEPFDAKAEKIYLKPHALGVTILADGFITDAIFDNIIVHRIPDFVEVVWLIVFVGVAVFCHLGRLFCPVFFVAVRFVTESAGSKKGVTRLAQIG